MRTLKKREGGFTLIELITVIIILGILAAVVTPKYFDMAAKAKDAAAEGALAEGVARLNMAASKYILDNGSAGTLAQIQAADLGTGNIDVGDYKISYAAGTTEDVAVAVLDDAGVAVNYEGTTNPVKTEVDLP